MRSLYSLFRMYCTWPDDTLTPKWSAATASSVCASSKITASYLGRMLAPARRSARSLKNNA